MEIPRTLSVPATRAGFTPGLTRGLPRVVHATGATAGRPYTSSRLAHNETRPYRLRPPSTSRVWPVTKSPPVIRPRMAPATSSGFATRLSG